MILMNYLNYLFLPAVLGPGVYSSSNINDYQNQGKGVLESRARPACKYGNLPSYVSRLYRQYVILDI
jgi:hypothetical protein